MSDDDAETAAGGADETEGAADVAQQNDDAASPRKVNRKRREKDRQEVESKEFWRGVFASPVGRREMWKLLQDAHTFEERFACGPNGFPQPEATWFQAGEQSLGQRIYRTFARDHLEGVLQMHHENDPQFKKARS